jgi:hypothetical protein
MGRFCLKKLNDGDVNEEYQATISNRSAALGNFNDNMDINTALKSTILSFSNRKSETIMG